ncbi:MAG: hypothetical protein H6703_11745 [Myxococcales bacterium]|nr:hypothetical protein [Myxococcales bacterium]MCB9553775.1 hypothetical protein [Myxococcales bacterium]
MRGFTVFARLALALACLSLPSHAFADDADAADAALCVDGLLSIEPVVEVTEDGGLDVTTFIASDPDGGYVAERVKYTCSSCNEGRCWPTWDGTKADCASETCSTCGLMANGNPANRIGNGCGTAPSDDTLDAIAARVAAIATWASDLGVPDAIYDDAGGEAVAPEGYRMAIEEIDGIGIAYVVPEDGAGPDGADLRLYGVRAKCRCSGRGHCHFAGIVCQGADCDDGCEITVRGRPRD